MSIRRVDLAVVAIVVALDQWTKAMIRGRFELHDSVDVVSGWLSLTRVHNSGAAFGVLNGVDLPYKPVILTIVTVAALAGVASYAAGLPASSRLARLGIAGVLGGAIGNLIDRVTAGYVLDFVDAYWGPWHFWAFNVADAAISVGVVLMILDIVLDTLGQHRAPNTV